MTNLNMKRVVFLGTKDLKLGINSRFEFYIGYQNGANFNNDKIMNDLYIPYARHHNPLLIRNRSWILTIHKVRILRKKPLEKTFLDFKKWVKSIQTAGYNGALTVPKMVQLWSLIKNNPNVFFISFTFYYYQESFRKQQFWSSNTLFLSKLFGELLLSLTAHFMVNPIFERL